MEAIDKYMTVDEYCGQKVKDIQKITSLIFDASTPKSEILTRALTFYYQKDLISEETYKLLSDPRFVRLYSSRVKNLQKLLVQRNIASPKQGKAKIVQLCYEQGLDVDVLEQTTDTTDSSDNSDSRDSDKVEGGFIARHGHIYFQTENKLYPISTKQLKTLFGLVLER